MEQKDICVVLTGAAKKVIFAYQKAVR